MVVVIKGCRVSISVYFAVFIACIIILDNSGLVIYALLCALIHEAGHMTVIAFLKIPVEEFKLKIFGINIKIKNNTIISYEQDILISLAGCAANFIFAFFCMILWILDVFSYYTYYLFLFNVILVLFNLIPIGPLDGGRALEAALCRRLKIQTAERVVNIISACCIIPLGVAGFTLVLKTGYNFSLILASAYLAASVLLKGSLLNMQNLRIH